MVVEFIPHAMQGAYELTPEIKATVPEPLWDTVYELMVQGAEIGWAAADSHSVECLSDCATHSLPAYLPGLCDCRDRR